jgi:cytochrome c-type biogenesis protein CcmF
MTETDLGHICAMLALACATYTAVAAAAGARLRRPGLVRSATRGVIATGGLIVLMTGALLYALWTHDFAVKYVAQYSNLEVPRIFNLSSLWAGQAGSLMFWCLLLNLFAVLVLWQHRGRAGGGARALMPWVVAVLMGYQVFFLGLINFVVESPWARLPVPPADGQGLMPLLQHPAMLVHPPALYLGYVGFSVPFAFAMAALITGRVGDEWIQATRRWVLLAWFFNGCGLLLGANWAYDELGWGGYWAWDPVENVALLPWLTGTAFLHSILIQQRRGMLKVWNMALIIATFCLTLFGTFMNRSGIESSVHAFEERGLGVPFITLICVTLLGAAILLYRRLPGLSATNRIDSIFSRESAFLANNLLLVGIAFAVFWGTIYPILSVVLRGPAGQVTVGAPFFDRVTGPLVLPLLLFMAAGPLLPWRKASLENLRRNLLRPLVAAALVVVGSFVALGNLFAALSFGVCAAVVFTAGMEFYRGTRVKRRATGYSWLRALVHLVDSNHGRYGGYLVHLGIALVALGVTGSTYLKVENQATVRLGQSMTVGEYRATPVRVTPRTIAGIGPQWTATVRITKGGRPVTTLQPGLILFQNQDNQPVSVVGLRSTPLQDIYVTLVQPSPDLKTVRLHVLINPLVWWIWAGGLVSILGGLVAFTPSARERRARVSVPAPVPATSRASARS